MPKADTPLKRPIRSRRVQKTRLYAAVKMATGTCGSEVELSRELDEPRRHERGRSQPCGTVGPVVGQRDARVRHVVDVQLDLALRWRVFFTVNTLTETASRN
jgi:hypothetical protein